MSHNAARYLAHAGREIPASLLPAARPEQEPHASAPFSLLSTPAQAPPNTHYYVKEHQQLQLPFIISLVSLPLLESRTIKCYSRLDPVADNVIIFFYINTLNLVLEILLTLENPVGNMII